MQYECFKIDTQIQNSQYIYIKSTTCVEEQAKKFTLVIQMVIYNNVNEIAYITKAVNYSVEIRNLVGRQGRYGWKGVSWGI